MRSNSLSQNMESTTKIVPREVKPSKWYLYFVTITVNILSFTTGVCFGWTSPAIPKMNGLEDQIHNPLPHSITHQEESLITSLLAVGVGLGSFAFGYMADKIGRKKTLLFSSIPITLSFVIMAFANDIAYFYMARLIGGFGCGAVFTVVPLYVGEIAENTNRGALGCIMPLFLTVGILFAYCTGPFLTLMVFNLINIIPPILFAILTIIYAPNSPYFLVTQNKKSQAEISLRVFRGRPSLVDVDKEMNSIMETVRESQTGKKNFIDIFKNRGTRNGICITFGLMLFQQFSGISVLLAYMQVIFEAAESSLDSHESAIVIGIVQCLACACTEFFVDKLGRKVLLIVSCVGVAFSNALMGACFYMKEDHELDHIPWLPILSLILFMMSYNLGLGPIPWAMMGELFPTNLKAKAATLTTFFCFFFTFTTNVAFPYVKEFVGYMEIFWFFSAFCVLGFLFVAVVVPETKGKSLHDILVMLNSKHTSSNSA